MLQFRDIRRAFPSRSGSGDFLANLFGAAALLLWGLRMVGRASRAYGAQIRQRLGKAMGNRFAAFFAGLRVTCVLQSSSATALVTSSFASRGWSARASALAIMLGADVGTNLVARPIPIGWLDLAAADPGRLDHVPN